LIDCQQLPTPTVKFPHLIPPISFIRVPDMGASECISAVLIEFPWNYYYPNYYQFIQPINAAALAIL